MKKRLRSQEGFTLPEMMVTMVVMVVVLFALYSIFDASVRVFRFGNDKIEAVENARLGLEKMERELRAAYPYDKGAATPDERLFDNISSSKITFGNDLNGDHVVDQTTEKITYGLNGTTLQRTVGNSAAQPVAEYVDSIKFEYLKRDASGNLVTANTEPEVEVVRVMLVVDKDGREQTLTTNVGLRSRS